MEEAQKRFVQAVADLNLALGQTLRVSGVLLGGNMVMMMMMMIWRRRLL